MTTNNQIIIGTLARVAALLVAGWFAHSAKRNITDVEGLADAFTAFIVAAVAMCASLKNQINLRGELPPPPPETK